jgi:hypothetical protein
MKIFGGSVSARLAGRKKHVKMFAARTRISKAQKGMLGEDSNREGQEG